jgi:large subunit ribosomal protein L25
MASKKLVLQAQQRTIIGKKVKQLRAKQLLPAHVYGNTEPINIQIDERAFAKLFAEAGETGLFYLTVEGEKEERPVLISDYLLDPILGTVKHVDLRQVDLNVKVKANVPFETTGESEAVKAGGVLITTINEIEVEALPADLPEKFVLDISVLKAVGDELKVSDLKYDASKITLTLSPDERLVAVAEQKVEVEEPVVVTPAEVETTVQGAKKDEEEGAAKTDEKASEKPAEKKAEK